MGVTELRKEGKLQEAYDLAIAELERTPDNIWAKRNLCWVYFDYLKKLVSIDKYSDFISYLEKITSMNMPADEKILYDQIAWQCGLMANKITGQKNIDNSKLKELFEKLKDLPFTKPGKGYSILFKGFHKGFKDSFDYLGFADWWGLDSFLEEDYQREKSQEGKLYMSLVEQAYITYAKHLLPVHDVHFGTIFNEEKVKEFLPHLDKIIDAHPEYQYPEFYKAKLLLAMGEKGNVLEVLLPFAKKKKREFWTWDVMSEAFPKDDERVIACWAKAVTCGAKEEYLINIRQRLAAWFIAHRQLNEAKTEIIELVKARHEQKWPIPVIVNTWMKQDWFANAHENKSNLEFYNKLVPLAEGILYSDIPEETIIVDFVNTDKQILNFIASETKFGFLKYGIFIQKVAIGDTFNVRFSGGGNEGYFQVLTLEKTTDPDFSKQFTKEIKGTVRIPEGRSNGHLNEATIFSSVVSKFNLKDGQTIQAKCIKSYNQDRKQWGWKVYDILGSQL